MREVAKNGKVCSGGGAAERCNCKGVCAGYAARRECPPLIVLAIAAMDLALGDAPSLLSGMTLNAGAR